MFHLAVALSAALLFLAEPLVARQLLPLFGGAAALWTTCLVFFQVALLGGYAWAHLLARRLRPRGQAIAHALLLGAGALFLPLAPRPALAEAAPALRALGTLGATLGVPFVALAATSPLAQAWHARLWPGSPYRLFAWSNAASLGALIAFPLAIEPLLRLDHVALAWSAGYGFFALAMAGLGWRAAAVPGPPTTGAAPAAGPPPGLRAVATWLVLAALPSALLAALTHHLTEGLASFPLLWTAPLAAYLLTLVLAFDDRVRYRGGVALALAGAAALGLAWLLTSPDLEHELPVQAAGVTAGLFLVAYACHGELAARRPPPASLTAFYLAVTTGGALGAVTVGIGAPLWLGGHYEGALALALWGAAAAALARRRGRWHALLPAAAALAALVALAACVRSDRRDLVRSTRTFYGVLRVREVLQGEGAPYRLLVSNAIIHGEQGLTPERRRRPTTYYEPTSGAGLALRLAQAAGPVRVGVVGLGTGTLAAYGRPGDLFRFYELDPAVAELARTEFTFLADTPATMELVLGDARTRLAAEPPQRLDLLVLDAFSGDAVPVHLLTAEALDVYRRHLRPGGVVAFHVSNRHLDLARVVEGVAARAGLAGVHVADEEAEYGSDWILVAEDPAFAARPEVRRAAEAHPCTALVWTDQRSSLLQVLR